jgi:eukaryotic-like serine/threonine-protein kinase
MASPEPPPSEREQHFNEVLAGYLEGLETGRPDDRTALLTSHPELADDLRAFFARQDHVQGLTTPLRSVASVNKASGASLEPTGVGDSSVDGEAAAATERGFPALPADQFRIVREVGRGGMGVVYEALELSLGRRVALKVLRAVDQADPRALQRFLSEARIVARLHHTNIVPIFQVGEHKGLHYFAMEFIDGRGLDNVLQEQRQTPRADNFAHDVARLGVQVAEALAHAHDHGVLHRDIKPSNLLLDPEGTVWVTDFGLAKDEHASLTDPGEVVGTLRYLAPERFSGAVDARSDVYGLGATLYELLTLRPLHDESDRAKLLAHILHDEPPRPRAIDGNIPRDLETIVLTALAKDPARRYPTARALADDLRRFLDDAPIHARRVSLLERGWRWCRRNPGIATSSIAAVLALLIGLGVALWQWQRADENAQHAEANAAQAKKDFELAFQAIEQMLERVGGEHLLVLPHMDQTRRALLQDAVRFYENLLRGKEDHPASRLALARAYLRLGQMHDILNDSREALRYLNQALALAQPLLDSDPNHVEYRHLVAAIFVHRGDAKGHADEEADYRRALAAFESLSAECPDRPLIVFGHAYALGRMGHLLKETRLAEAESLLRQCVAVAEKLPAGYRYRSWMLASGLRSLAEVLESNGSLKESERAARRALDLFDRAARQSPETVSRHELATTLRNLAQFQARSAKANEAEKLYKQSVDISERLVADFPDVPAYRVGLANTANNLGWLLLGRGKTPEAGTMLERSVGHLKDLVGKFPDLAAYRVGLGGVLHNLALQRRARGDLDAAKALFEEAIEHQEKVAKVSPEQANTLEYLANHGRGLADILVKLGRAEQAEEAVSRQRTLAQKLAEKDGKSAAVLVFQARTCENLSHLRNDTNRPGDAVAAYGEAARYWRKLVADFPDTPNHASQLGAALNDCAVLLRKQARWDDMMPLLDEAIRVQEAAVQARPEVPVFQQFLYNHHSVRADARLGLGDHADVSTTAAMLRKRFPARLDNYVWAVRLARCIPLAQKDPHLSQENRAKLVRQYADASMAFLRAAQQKQSKDLPQIHINPAFAPLRGRADFQELLAEVAKPGKSAK